LRTKCAYCNNGRIVANKESAEVFLHKVQIRYFDVEFHTCQDCGREFLPEKNSVAIKLVNTVLSLL